MKKLILFLVFCSIVLANNAQELDTVLVRKDNTVLIVVKPKNETTIATLEFSKVNSWIFSDEEIKQLAKGKEVIKKSREMNLPFSLLPVVRPKKFYTIRIYGKEGQTIKKTKPDIKVFGPAELKKEKSFIVFVSLGWLYLPLFCIFILSFISAQFNTGRKEMINFAISTTFLIILAIILVFFIFTGPDDGLLLGVILGAFAGALFGGVTGVIYGNIAGGLAGLLAGLFSGLFAGMFIKIGYSFNSPEFQIIWQYLGLYFLVCLAAVGLRELFALKRKAVV